MGGWKTLFPMNNVKVLHFSKPKITSYETKTQIQFRNGCDPMQ